MGNSNNRRATRSTPAVERIPSPSPPTQLIPIVLAIKEDWNDTAYVKKLILEKKLAPSPVNGQEIRDQECPICFLNFECLNSVSCCKQNVCTECFVQLKSSNAKCACPFCGKDSFMVTYVSSSSSLVTPPKMKNSNSSLVRGTFSRATTEVITPDSAASEKLPLFIPQSSKSDRDALEEQIKSQRQHYFDEDVVPGPTFRTNSGAAANLNSTFSFQRARTQQFGRLANPNSVYDPTRSVLRSRLPLRDGLGPFPSPPPPAGSSELLPAPPARGHYSPRYRGSNSSEPALFASSSAPAHAVQNTAGPPLHDRDLFMSSIQSLLGGEQLSGLDQLEELMLMEAIRLSMSDMDSLSTAVPESAALPENVQTSTSNDFIVSNAIQDTPVVDNTLEEIDLAPYSRESDEMDSRNGFDTSDGVSFPQPSSTMRTRDGGEEDLADRDDLEDDESFAAAEFRSYRSHKKRDSRSSSDDSSCSDSSSVASSLLLPFHKLTTTEGNGSHDSQRETRPPEERSGERSNETHLKNGFDSIAGSGSSEIALKGAAFVPLPPAARSGLYLHCRSPSEHLSKTSSHGSTDLSSSSSLLEKIQLALDSPAASRMHRSSSADTALGIASMRCSPVSHDPAVSKDSRCSVVTPDLHELPSSSSHRFSSSNHSSSFPELQGVAEQGREDDKEGRKVFFIPQGDEAPRLLQSSSSVDEPLDELQMDFF